MARVLVIEDDGALRSELAKRLVERGHFVVEAANGQAGLDCFREEPPEIVFVDILMPIMDGIETIRAIRRERSQPPIVAMSGNGVDGAIPAAALLKMAKQMGACQTLAKPFSMQDFDAATDAALAASKAPTFLVLDDDTDARFLSRYALQKAFPQSAIIECSSVGQALLASEASRPSAIITDHHLGQEDGVSFFAQLRSKGVDCPVVMVTGNSDPEVHRKAYAAGADRVIHGSRPDFIDYLRQRLSLD